MNDDCLPAQQDPDGTKRAKDLEAKRSEYQYSYTHVSPLALVDNLPIRDEFSREWLNVVAHSVSAGWPIMPSSPALPIPNIAGDRQALLIRLIELGRGSVRGSRASGRSLRKQWQESGLPDRPEGLEAYARMFRAIGLPPIHRDYHRDDVFAEMRVAGPNPVMLRRVSGSMIASRSPSRSISRCCPAIRWPRRRRKGGSTWPTSGCSRAWRAAASPRSRSISMPPGPVRRRQGLRQARADRHPVQARPGPDNPIFTPGDGYNWLIAKTIVGIADGNVHEAVTHLGRTHLFMEPFVLATVRQLASNHPLFTAPGPHFEGTTAINKAAWRFLVADKGPVDKMMAGTIQGTAPSRPGCDRTSSGRRCCPPPSRARGDDLRLAPLPLPR